jgi:hypothetical protein
VAVVGSDNITARGGYRTRLVPELCAGDVLYADLPRPSALDQRAWAAIEDAFGRLRGAAASDDRPLIVGSAKDLVEATARVVLEARGLPAGSEEKYDAVLGNAQRAIEHQLGSGVAPDAAVRQAATFARNSLECSGSCATCTERAMAARRCL